MKKNTKQTINISLNPSSFDFFYHKIAAHLGMSINDLKEKTITIKQGEISIN